MEIKMDTCVALVKTICKNVDLKQCARIMSEIMSNSNIDSSEDNTDSSDEKLQFEKIKDDDILQIAKQLELDKPENMFCFVVNFYMSALDDIDREINNLKRYEIHSIIAQVQSAVRKFEYGMDNPGQRQIKFNTAQDNLFDATELLQCQIRNLVNEIREVDNRDKWNFFFKAATSLKNVDTNMYLIRLAINALEQAANLQVVIAAQLGADIDKSVIAPYRTFWQELFDSNTCELLDAYETKDRRKDKFFLKLPEHLEKVYSLNNTYIQYKEQYEQ
jgi:hypothetical protein